MISFTLKGGKTLKLHGLRGSADMYYLASLKKKAVVVTSSPDKMSVIAAHYQSFRPTAKVLVLPPLDGLPYSFTPVHAATRRARLLTLAALDRGDWDLLITVPQSFAEPLPPKEYLAGPQLHFVEGESYDLSELTRTLAAMGYHSSDLVTQPGDFSKRGGILDIYSFADDCAYRLDFFDDELEEIRTFDPGNQRSTGGVGEVVILPMYEWSIDAQAAETFGKKGGALWNKTDARGHFLELVAQIRDRGRFPGYLHWTRLFFENCRHFHQGLGPITYFIDNRDLVHEAWDTWFSQLTLQNDAHANSDRLTAPPRSLFGLDKNDVIHLDEEATVIVHGDLNIDGATSLPIQSVPRYNNDVRRFLDHWQTQAQRQAVIVFAKNRSLLQRLEESFKDIDLQFSQLRFDPDTIPAPGFYLTQGHLETGFTWADKNLTIFSEDDIWTRKGKSKRQATGKKVFQSEFRDLKINDFVVHLDHGVGRFLGLVEMEAGGLAHEMMAIEYRDNQKLYVHLNQLDLIQRYGSSDTVVQLDRMGGTAWVKAKAKAKKAIKEMAGELVKLYATRKVVEGHQYGPDTEWQMEFEESFEHQATHGQLNAVADIKQDLGKPMDRLLVGDVGFGKTEVSMRMAFKVVMEGFQVAVLCPTTVLAFQHYHTFKNRFDGWPVNIQWVSRFTSPSATKKTLSALADGDVDILIGTHRILSKDVVFKKLGALIIDEEQRFGVAHKEKLKTLRKKVDVLSMSATPIPRTLNMAMTGIRDISVIESPPRNRLAIATTVAESRESLIRNAINFELDRKGQIFFIHNRVETMDSVAGNLKRIVPSAEIAMAHGQMDPKEIEKVMLAFMKRDVDILVASTIIENGVDIPNANTMIVNRADMFGMSQLYQLRGRIGRSDRPAYAYFLVPERARMTPLARKRLAALEEFSYLGSGFRIAAMDLELRGAGNLLGGQQAGHINAIGFDMYMRLLEDAVNELKGVKAEDEIHTLLKLGFGASIPRQYIEETNQRLHYYKKLAGAKEATEIYELQETMVDCFGPMPSPVKQLCNEGLLKLDLSVHKVLLVERDKDKIRFRFDESANINGALIFRWIQEGRDIQVTPEGVITQSLDSVVPEQVLESIRAMVAALLAPS